jgi:hypothetical protein
VKPEEDYSRIKQTWAGGIEFGGWTPALQSTAGPCPVLKKKRLLTVLLLGEAFALFGLGVRR